MKSIKAWAVVHRSTRHVCMCGNREARIYASKEDLEAAGWTGNGAFKIVRVVISELKPKRKARKA